MFVVDLERFKALSALYFLNTIQPEELEELKYALNTGESELRKIFYQTKKELKGSMLAGRFIDTYIEEKEPIEAEPRLKDILRFPIFKLYLGYWTGRIKIRMVLAAFIAAAAGLIFLSFYTSRLKNQVNEMKEVAFEKNSALSLEQNAVDIMHYKDLALTDLKGMNIDPEGFGRVIWSSSAGKAILVIDDLPPAGKGKIYHLWLNKNNNFYNMGTFSVSGDDPMEFFTFLNPPLNKKETDYTFMVTLEKRGVKAKPEGTVYLNGRNVN